jgi:uncharacterized protein YcfL
MKGIFSLSLLLCLLTITGCQSTGPSGQPYAGETRLDTFTGVGVNLNGRLTESGTLDPAPFLGKFLPNQEVRITDVTAAPNASGLPRVQFAIQSQKDKPQAFQYRFTWTDGDGFVIQPDQNPWQTVHLQGREVAYIGSTARSPGARAFRLIIRPLEFKK